METKNKNASGNKSKNSVEDKASAGGGKNTNSGGRPSKNARSEGKGTTTGSKGTQGS